MFPEFIGLYIPGSQIYKTIVRNRRNKSYNFVTIFINTSMLPSNAPWWRLPEFIGTQKRLTTFVKPFVRHWKRQSPRIVTKGAAKKTAGWKAYPIYYRWELDRQHEVLNSPLGPMVENCARMLQSLSSATELSLILEKRWRLLVPHHSSEKWTHLVIGTMAWRRIYGRYIEQNGNHRSHPFFMRKKLSASLKIQMRQIVTADAIICHLQFFIRCHC